MFRSLLHFGVSLVLLGCFADRLAGWSPITDITNGPTYEVGPRAARDGAGNIHMVWYGGADDSSGWKIYCQTYDGSSWSAATEVSGAAAAYPAIAVDGSNNLHVVWHAGGNPEEIYYRKRMAGVWGPTVNLSNSAAARSLGARVAVDSTGNHILVTWHEADQNAGNWDIIARKCTAGSWGPLENVSNDSTLSRNADVTIDGGLNFHVAWEDTDNKHMFYRKRNADGSYAATIYLDTSSGRSYGPSLAVSPNGYVHVVWIDDNSDWDVHYRYFNGVSWSADTNISNHPGVTDAGATIAVDGNNQAYVLWHDYSNIYYAHTVNGAWRPWYVLSKGTYQQTGVVVIDGGNRKHALWPCRMPGTWDVWWSSEPAADVVPPGGVSGLVAQAADSQVALSWTNPSDVDFAGTMVRFKTTGYPTGPTDGTLLLNRSTGPGKGDSFVHTGLTNGTACYYAFFTYDVEPNYSAAVCAVGTPAAGPKPNLLLNPRLDGFTAGVAASWSAYRVNDPGNVLSFIADTGTNNYVSSPSQGILNIDSYSLPSTGLTAAGIYQVVSGLTPGRIYQFVGSQDIYCETWSGADQRYLVNFGINPNGGASPGTPTTDGTIGGSKWMTPSQACWNNMSVASPVYFSGFHRSTAAFPAQASSVSVWSGVTISNAGVRDSKPAKFNTDHHYLYAWDFPANVALVNGDFEGSQLDLQDGGDVIPIGWLPAGGGIGQWNVWRVSNYSTEVHSGVYGAHIANRRGTVCAGFMQKIGTAPAVEYRFSAYVRTTGQDGTIGAIGIDPYAGGDITSGNIVWTTTTSSTWVQLAVTAVAQGPAVTVFLRTYNTNADGDAYHHSHFDDCTFGTVSASGTITGTVIDECGAAVSGATVSTDVGGYSTTTAANGTYALLAVTPGTYGVTASKAGYVPASQAGVVVSNGTTTTVDFTPSRLPSGTIAGAVHDTGGAPIVGAIVRTDTGEHSMTEAPDGSYTLSGLAAGVHAVTASAAGFSVQTRSDVSVTNCQPVTVDFDLPPGAASDLDGDGDVDLTDFSQFQGCFNGPNRPAAREDCTGSDLDHDGDVDLSDFSAFQGCFNGPNRPPACPT